tara:strand:+ start:264 stop:461 length:198 start_codon:yes stop_codon:yes gene_type:complete
MTYYQIDPLFQSDYSLGPSVLVRIDSRGTGLQTVHTYAPITVGGQIIYSERFEDAFNEVIELKLK